MATESAGETELSVSLSPSLHEWLDERAAALGVEREALLVQLLGTYRATADLDDSELVELFERTDLDETIENAVDARLESGRTSPEDIESELEDTEARIDGIDTRVDDVEAKLEHNVEDIRNRVLQLRDALESRAPADHGHGEIDEVSDRVESLSNDLDSFESEIGAVTDSIDGIEKRLESVDSKLDRLARVVLALKRREEADVDERGRFDHIRRAANRGGTTTATCESCGEAVQIDLLTEAACPHCGQRFTDLDVPTSIRRWFTSPTLTVETGDTESGFTFSGDQADDE